MLPFEEPQFDGMENCFECESDCYICDGQCNKYLERPERSAINENACVCQFLDADFGDHAGGEKQKNKLAGERGIYG
jgi:hypothetical protein